MGMKPIPAKFRPLIAYLAVILVVLISASWLWHLNTILTKQNEWCISENVSLKPELCGGIAERDIQRAYYLRIIMLSILTFGSAGMLLAASEQRES